MRLAYVLNKEGNRDVIETYSIYDFPYHKLNTHRIHSKKKKIKSYHEEFWTFDIESTSILDEERYISKFAYMYHWQMCIGGICVTGRTWEEWIKFLDKLQYYYKFDYENRIVCYVHNLAFEFVFMYKFLEKHYGQLDIFASKARKPMKVTAGNGIEFRCSYFLTNMNLNGFTKNENVEHPKALNDLDYRKIRTSKSKLSDEEFGYCISDVLGLYEALKSLMKHYKDTIDSIPITSTSYIRRDVRNECKKDRTYRKRTFLKMQFDEELYMLLKEAGRGGNTHANRYFSSYIVPNVFSFDAVSEYPAMLLLKKFPMDKFCRYGKVDSMEELHALMTKYACLFRVAFTNLRLKPKVAIPYIVKAKIKTEGRTIIDNGRILEAEGNSLMTVTDIDWKIIERQYEWDAVGFSTIWISKYDYLPSCITDYVFKLFAEKCELKEEMKAIKKAYPKEWPKREDYQFKEYLYNKLKNKLNGIFGMMYTDPCHSEIVFKEGEWNEEELDIKEALEKFFKSKNSFLLYFWGVWTTARGREHLQRLLDITGENTLYCDTDSDKCIEPDYNKIEELNQKIMKEVEDRGYLYTSKEGNKYYIGVFEDETSGVPYKRFSTLGAKKYCYEDEFGLHTTIAGVNKKKGAVELKSIENFKIGFTFYDAGGLTLTYIDEDIHTVEVDGCKMTSAANICMEDSTYTIGITNEYAELLKIDLL